MSAFYEMFQAMSNFCLDPLKDSLSQLATFVKAGPPEFDGFQGSLTANRWIKAIQNTFFLLGTVDEL